MKKSSYTSQNLAPLFIGCDHAGFSLKNHFLQAFPHLHWNDLGVFDETPASYSDVASRLCEKMRSHPLSQGVLICGSGQGMAMRANKYPHVRAALVWSESSAQLARSHNNANIICLGARLLSNDLAEKLLIIFLETEFAGGRHQERVNKIGDPC